MSVNPRHTTRQRESMLPMIWTLRDVVDVEGLCRGVIAAQAGREGRRYALEPADYDETLAYLLGQVVLEEERFVRKGYDRRPGYLFRPWLYQQLGSRTIDFWRFFFGRAGEKRVPDLGLVEILHGGEHEDDGAVGDDRLGRAPGGSPGDDQDDWAADCGGLLGDADRDEDRPSGGSGDRSPAPGDAGPGGGPGGEAASARGLPAAPWLDCGSCGYRNYPQAPNGLERWHYEGACRGCGAPIESEVAA